jgi:hypothetical protein
MSFHRKRADPIDRAIDDLDRQIATLQGQLRAVETHPGRALHHRAAPMQTVAKFVKGILVPPKQTAGSSARARQDLFEVGAEPLKDLEAEPIAFAKQSDADLFAGAPIGPVAALETAQVVPSHEKLAHYLGAGSIKSYKPLKHVQRKIRNRFFMWLGLSFAALWIIWFVIR